MSRSDYKNIYEGYLDNTGYNNRYSFRERYGGCGSEPTPYTINEGYLKSKPITTQPPTTQPPTTTTDPRIPEAQAYIKNTYNNTLNYVNKFRNKATDYYNSGAKYYDGMNTGQSDNSMYSKYVVYKDVTQKYDSYCNLPDTVRSRYFIKNGPKSEICCKENITVWGYCDFNSLTNANLDLRLDLFTFRVDVLQDEINKKYPKIEQQKLKYPTVKFTDTQNI